MSLPPLSVGERLAEVADILAHEGLELQDHQYAAVQQAANAAWNYDNSDDVTPADNLRMCLYHRTGAGKTISSLGAIKATGAERVLVLAPPITHKQWEAWGKKFGIKVTAISHAKFRQKDYKVLKNEAIIVDEFHLLGGHTGQGWKKMDGLAKRLMAPLVICSATPNYNDAERVYCVQHVMDPDSVKGGFLQFLYTHCETEQNPFGSTPKVLGFKNGQSAEQYLAALWFVHYVEDEVIKQITIEEVEVERELPANFIKYGLDEHGKISGDGLRHPRIMASQMEERHTAKRLRILKRQMAKPYGHTLTVEAIMDAGRGEDRVLVFCASSHIAEGIQLALEDRDNINYARLVTGKTTGSEKLARVKEFTDKIAYVKWLVGTATMATGTDGLDKVCDMLIIVDDTDDPSLRRQLIGRILPRGTDTDISKKRILRLVYPTY